jgi:hypothetical protein
MEEYFSIKWLDKYTAIRKTKEVEIKATYKDNKLTLEATGDLDHHILEDSIILINKMAKDLMGDEVVK